MGSRAIQAFGLGADAPIERSDTVDTRHGANPPGRVDFALGCVRGLDHSPTMAGDPFLAQGKIHHVRMCMLSLNLL
jgi:hypothetical protein